jgi:hypothetical protein
MQRFETKGLCALNGNQINHCLLADCRDGSDISYTRISVAFEAARQGQATLEIVRARSAQSLLVGRHCFMDRLKGSGTGVNGDARNFGAAFVNAPEIRKAWDGAAEGEVGQIV